MAKGLNSRMSRLTNTLVCGVGILAFGVAGIYPQYKAIAELDRKIAFLESEIKAQQSLFPLFTQLLRKSREKVPNRLPLPEPRKLPRGDTEEISRLISETARKAGVEIAAFTPDMNSLVGKSGSLEVDVRVKGAFADFRSFIAELESSPYLAQLLRIEIVSDMETGTPEMRLLLLLNQS